MSAVDGGERWQEGTEHHCVYGDKVKETVGCAGLEDSDSNRKGIFVG